jgi:hypothetical protein
MGNSGFQSKDYRILSATDNFNLKRLILINDGQTEPIEPSSALFCFLKFVLKMKRRKTGNLQKDKL